MAKTGKWTRIREWREAQRASLSPDELIFANVQGKLGRALMKPLGHPARVLKLTATERSLMKDEFMANVAAMHVPVRVTE